MHNLHRPEPSGPEFRYEGPIQDAPQAQKTHPLAFPELRILAQAAYNLAMEKLAGALAAAECSAQVGAMFYPQNLPGDQRRLGAMLVVIILGLEERLKRKELLGGPALHEDTRRLLVADIIATAHLQSKDMGFLQKKVGQWVSCDDATLDLAGAPVLDPGPDGTIPATEKGHEEYLERRKRPLTAIVSSAAEEDLRFAFARLEAVVHGVAFMTEADIDKDYAPAAALRTAFYEFQGHLRPLLKGED